MTTVPAAGLAFHTRIDGAEDGRPWIVLAHSLAADLTMWDPQIPLLTRRYRVLRYDTRGHGRTPPGRGPCTIETLADDVVALMDRLGIARADFMGLSLGGMTGLALGLRHPDRFDRMVIAAARPDCPEPVVRSWDERIAIARGSGSLAPLLEVTLGRWFTAETLARRPELVARARAMIEATPAEGYVACAEALKALGFEDRLSRIRNPVLFVVGSDDISTPPAVSRAMSAAVGGSAFAEVADAAHIVNMEAPDGYDSAIGSFLGLR